jgi:hypothetical protein
LDVGVDRQDSLSQVGEDAREVGTQGGFPDAPLVEVMVILMAIRIPYRLTLSSLIRHHR